MAESANNSAVTADFVYDSGRRRMILVRGDQTWEFDGAVWKLTVADNPMGGTISGVGLAYDSSRARTVLFGSQSMSATTWEYDGSSWTAVALATSPPGRWLAPMVYDQARQRVVLYGGETAIGRRNDTWEYDGSNWQQRFPTNAPSSFLRHAMAYDRVRGVTVLFGGLDAAGTIELDETWEFAGLLALSAGLRVSID